MEVMIALPLHQFNNLIFLNSEWELLKLVINAEALNL